MHAHLASSSTWSTWQSAGFAQVLCYKIESFSTVVPRDARWPGTPGGPFRLVRQVGRTPGGRQVVFSPGGAR